MTAMKNDNATERAVALLNEFIDAMCRTNRAPDSPVNTLLSPKLRHELRRRAERLRQGKAQPKYANLYTAEELADICERTVRRDEILEPALQDFRRISRELGRITKENPEVVNALGDRIVEAKRLAEESGPGSEAARRYQHMLLLASYGRQSRSPARRGKAPDPSPISLVPDPSVQLHAQMSAMQLLASPPASGETVIAIPPEGMDSGRGRVFVRIGTEEWKWFGSFERGRQTVSTACVMPDNKHLFVSVEGAGYILDAQSRTLVETLGTEVVGVMRDGPLTLLVVDHGGRSLEAFGKSGRLWKTGTISAGGFRRTALTEDALVGELRHPTRKGWAWFFVRLATGEVEMAGGRG